jgi:hypothetical protein
MSIARSWIRVRAKTKFRVLFRVRFYFKVRDRAVAWVSIRKSTIVRSMV